MKNRKTKLLTLSLIVLGGAVFGVTRIMTKFLEIEDTSPLTDDELREILGI